MEQCFAVVGARVARIDGILKRVVSNAQGREMILRFAAESDIDTSYAAWRLKTRIPYAIRTVTRADGALVIDLGLSWMLRPMP